MNKQAIVITELSGKPILVYEIKTFSTNKELADLRKQARDNLTTLYENLHNSLKTQKKRIYDLECQIKHIEHQLKVDHGEYEEELTDLLDDTEESEDLEDEGIL